MMTQHLPLPAYETASNSEIQTYKRCKRKWWLTYYRKRQLIRGVAKER